MTMISYVDPPRKPEPVIVMVCNNVFMDYRKILRYNSNETFSYESYEFLHQAALGNDLFNDEAWVLSVLSKDLFLISNRIKEEFKLDLDEFMIACFVTNTGMRL